MPEPVPPPAPVGPVVDPLGELFIKELPDGLYWLLAPAAALPALLFTPGVVALPELPVVEPLVEEPVPVPLEADPPAEPPPAEPPPLCANATVLVSASAAANPIAKSLMVIFHFCCWPKDKALADHPFPTACHGKWFLERNIRVAIRRAARCYSFVLQRLPPELMCNKRIVTS